MPRKVKELSAAEVRRLTWNSNPDTGKPYNTLHAVGGVSGLLLQVTPTDAKSWIYRTVIGGKRHSMGLGGYPDITLAQAREKARELKLAIDRGEDPLEEKRARKREIKKQKLSTITFEKAFTQYMQMKSKEFKNQRQALQWENSIMTYAYPVLKTIPVGEIELTHIKAVLDPIWEEKTETAKRIQGRLEMYWDGQQFMATGAVKTRLSGKAFSMVFIPHHARSKRNSTLMHYHTKNCRPLFRTYAQGMVYHSAH